MCFIIQFQLLEVDINRFSANQFCIITSSGNHNATDDDTKKAVLGYIDKLSVSDSERKKAKKLMRLPLPKFTKVNIRKSPKMSEKAFISPQSES